MRPDPNLEGLASAEWQGLQAAVEKFEAAWDSGSPPDLEDCLPDEPATRLRVLIELVHVDLERRLKSGLSARVEEYLHRFPELTGEPAVELIAAEYHHRRQLGDADATPEVYLRRFPEYSAHLGDLTTASSSIGFEPAAAKDTVGNLQPSHVRPWTSVVTSDVTDLPIVPGYQILEELGRGGLGCLYKGRQIALNRLVAIKMIRAGRLASLDDRVRFRNEAEAVANLDHPNIVQVYDSGSTAECPLYIVSKYIAGATLADRIPLGWTDVEAVVELV